MRRGIIFVAVMIIALAATNAFAEGGHIGAGVRLGPIGVRLEWESLEGGDSENLSMVSLGATLGF
jgi:hypothetical protein